MRKLVLLFPFLIIALFGCTSSYNDQPNNSTTDSTNSLTDERKQPASPEQILGQWKEVAYSFSIKINERLTSELVGGMYFTTDTIYFLEKGDSIISKSAKYELKRDSLLVYFDSDPNVNPHFYNIWFYNDTLVRREWGSTYEHYRSSYYLPVENVK